MRAPEGVRTGQAASAVPYFVMTPQAMRSPAAPAGSVFMSSGPACTTSAVPPPVKTEFAPALSVTPGPTWTAGTGAPTATQPLGSLYSRTDGGIGATLYVSRGGGAWNPVAGV